MAGQRLSSRVPGPLAGFAPGYDIRLEGRGICRRAVRDRLWQLAYLSEWLDGQGLSARDLDRRCTEKHLAERRAAGCVDWVAPSSPRVPLEYLREIGAVPTETEPPAGPVDRLLVDYREYLVLERRFAPRTVEGCKRVARVFLEDRERRRGALEVGELVAADVSEFLARESRRWTR
jgi:integrase/recombinase XerD